MPAKIRGQQVSRRWKDPAQLGQREARSPGKRGEKQDPRQCPPQSEVPSALPPPKSRNPACQEASPAQPGASAPPAGTRFRRSAGKGRRGPGTRRGHCAGAACLSPRSRYMQRHRQSTHPAQELCRDAVLVVSPLAAAITTRSRHPPLTFRFLARRPRPSAAIARVSAGRTPRAWNCRRRADWPGKRARAPAGGCARTRGTTPPPTR